MTTTTVRNHITEILLITNSRDGTAHRPVCTCGWVGTARPLGYYDTARADANRHQETHQ